MRRLQGLWIPTTSSTFIERCIIRKIPLLQKIVYMKKKKMIITYRLVIWTLIANLVNSSVLCDRLSRRMKVFHQSHPVIWLLKLALMSNVRSQVPNRKSFLLLPDFERILDPLLPRFSTNSLDVEGESFYLFHSHLGQCFSYEVGSKGICLDVLKIVNTFWLRFEELEGWW